MVASRKDKTVSRYEHVPDELKRQKKNWALWDPSDNRKRPRKLNGSPMEWKKKPETRLSFEDVEHYPHIETFINQEDDYVGVDYDGCRNKVTGEIDPEVKRLIQDTFAEVSPSEEGVKAWYKAAIPNDKAIKYNRNSAHFTDPVPWDDPDNPKDHCGIEIYSHSRPFTITGNIVPGCPSEINEAPDIIHELVTKYAPKPKEKKPPKEPKENKKTNTPFDAPDGYWSLETWKSWCFQNLTVKADLGDSLIIECPWEHLHTTPSIKDTKIWYGPPHTFNCFHAHCDGRTWNDVHPTEAKQSRSKEESFKHFPSYPEITIEEQEEQLRQAALQMKQFARDHIEAKDGTAAIIACPQGVGKSHVMAGFVVKEEIDTAWMAPTHKVAQSVPTLQAIQHIQTCNKKNCSHPELHYACGQKGYNAVGSIHKQHNCEYWFQFLKEGSKVYMQQFYRSAYPASHDLVVNDEANLPDWLPERRITITQLQKADKYNDPDSEDSHFSRAVQTAMTNLADKKPVHGKPFFDHMDKSNQLMNWMGYMIKRYSNTLPKTGIDLDNELYDELTHIHNKPDVILPHLIKAMAAEIVKWQSGKDWNSRISIRRNASGEVAIYITEPRQLLAPKGEQFPTFIHLDASVDEEIHSKLFERELKILRTPINPAPGTKHLAVRNTKRYGKKSQETRLKDGSINEALKKTIKEAKYMLRYHTEKGKKVGLISHMNCVDEIAEALGIPEERTMYFWNLRGSNDLETCDVLLLIGTPALDPLTVARMARSLYFDDPLPIDETWSKEKGYADPRMQHIAQFLTTSELSQAAHRIRPIRHANKTIISFCEGDIDYLPITETFNVLPDMTDEGENLHDEKRNEAEERVRVAYEELSKDGNRPTTEEVRKQAHVKRNTVVEWIQNNTEENKSTPRHTIVDYIGATGTAEIFPSEVPKEGQEPMINPDDLQHYHGIEKDAKVITPLGQGTVVLIRGIRPKEVRVTVSVDRLGWKSFDWKEVKPFIKATQEPLINNKALDELFGVM